MRRVSGQVPPRTRLLPLPLGRIETPQPCDFHQFRVFLTEGHFEARAPATGRDIFALGQQQIGRRQLAYALLGAMPFRRRHDFVIPSCPQRRPQDISHTRTDQPGSGQCQCCHNFVNARAPVGPRIYWRRLYRSSHSCAGICARHILVSDPSDIHISGSYAAVVV